MDERILYGGAAAVVLVALLMSKRSGATVINSDHSAEAVADASGRASFAASGLESLASVARADIGSVTTLGVARAQLLAQQSRDAASVTIAGSHDAASRAAADAQARAAGKGKTGFSVPTPWGDFGIHW